ncbi:hypothetical protein [Microbulbifer aggregans]|uniref:hypothetical protein n=1 Tax=Microbulbifer aggregans TaxID=1769779 RepID=UPI001CFD075A|nr:hypothetical protein [Microbulbifer aggregans]
MSKTLLVGPSHLTRWRYEVKVGSLPKIPGLELWGRMGCPIFSNLLIETIRAGLAAQKKVVLLVPDFRMGNSVLKDDRFIKNGKIVPNHEHIKLDRSFISDSNDRFMYSQALSYLDEFLDYENAKDNLKFVFWSLFSREFRNRSAGKYLNEFGCFSHPVWNLHELESRYSDNIIGLSNLVSKSECSAYFLDQQGHPSFKGYGLLVNALQQDGGFDESHKFLCRVYPGVSRMMFGF